MYVTVILALPMCDLDHLVEIEKNVLEHLCNF